MFSPGDAQKTREQLLMTAFSAMHKNGFRATGINDILEKTGLTKGAFYYHFSNKAALGYAIIEEVLMPMVDLFWLKPIAGAPHPLTRMQEVFLTTNADLNSVTLG